MTEPVVVPSPGVYRGSGSASIRTTAADAAAGVASESERRARFELVKGLRQSFDQCSNSTLRPTTTPELALPSGPEAHHGGGGEARLTAAERALRRLQCENDELKHRELGLRQEGAALQGLVRALREEMELMGATIAQQTAALRAASESLQRKDACRVVRDLRAARPPESIVGEREAEGEAEAARMVRALERLSFALEYPQNALFRAAPAVERVYSLDVCVLSCVNLSLPPAASPAAGPPPREGTDCRHRRRLNPFAVLTGPYGQRCTTRTERHTCCPIFAEPATADGGGGPRIQFRALRQTSQVLRIEVWSRQGGKQRTPAHAADQAPASDVFIGAAALPVNAILAHYRSTARARRAAPSHTISSLHSVPLMAAAVTGEPARISTGSVTLEVVVHMPLCSDTTPPPQEEESDTSDSSSSCCSDSEDSAAEPGSKGRRRRTKTPEPEGRAAAAAATDATTADAGGGGGAPAAVENSEVPPPPPAVVPAPPPPPPA